MSKLPEQLKPLLERVATGCGPVVILTGAGISAESGIPTFRGEEGYWRVGSRNYHPQEMATLAAFRDMPDEVWSWYLFRRSVCRAASPNAAHHAVVGLERGIQDRFLLITQNVDGLHLRSGNTPARTYQVHGNIDFMRCSSECTGDVFPMPEAMDLGWERGRALTKAERALLVCPHCGALSRPHVLWFDETYDENFFRYQSSLQAAVRAEILVVVGTAGQTTLPLRIAMVVAQREAPMVVVNADRSPFSEFAARNPLGVFLEGSAGEWVPPLLEQLGDAAQGF